MVGIYKQSFEDQDFPYNAKLNRILLSISCILLLFYPNNLSKMIEMSLHLKLLRIHPGDSHCIFSIAGQLSL